MNIKTMPDMKKLLILMTVLCAWSAQAQNKNYITRVFDFMPAPGQFVNNSPEYHVGEPRDSVMARVLQRLGPEIKVIPIYDDDDNQIGERTVEKPVTGRLISLGAFGGYVIFGFDHPLVNVPGEFDLQIFGNGFGSDSLAVAGGSSEPGIVVAGVDMDGDGVPSAGDKWYELAGSEHSNAKTQKNFSITYYRPDENKTPVPNPNNSAITDMEYVRWTCNSTDSLTEGYVARNQFHSQSYWPQWTDADSLTFSGTKLRCNAVDASGVGRYYVQYFFDWGYVDNRTDYDYGIGANSTSSEPYSEAVRKGYNLGFNLDWAIDADGNSVNLTKVDFIKVYSALLQDCGWLGETSTEVCGAIDLHPDAPIPADPVVRGDVTGDNTVDVSDVNEIINIMLGKASKVPAADITGDGTVDVSDVNQVINIMLGKQ